MPLTGNREQVLPKDVTTIAFGTIDLFIIVIAFHNIKFVLSSHFHKAAVRGNAVHQRNHCGTTYPLTDEHIYNAYVYLSIGACI